MAKRPSQRVRAKQRNRGREESGGAAGLPRRQLDQQPIPAHDGVNYKPWRPPPWGLYVFGRLDNVTLRAIQQPEPKRGSDKAWIIAVDEGTWREYELSVTDARDLGRRLLEAADLTEASLKAGANLAQRRLAEAIASR